MSAFTKKNLPLKDRVMAVEWKRDKSPIIARAIELSFAIICTGLIVDPFNVGLEKNMNHAGKKKYIIYVYYTTKLKGVSLRRLAAELLIL